MSFKAEGRFKCKVEEVAFAEAKFAADVKGAFDVCLLLVSVDDPSQSDWWRGEVSTNYGKNNFASMTQYEITMRALHNVGFEGDDLSTLEKQLLGKEIPANVKATTKEGQTYYNVKYIGEGGSAPDKIEVKDMKERLSILFGAKAEAADPFKKQPEAKPEATQAGNSTPPPATTAKANPFLRK